MSLFQAAYAKGTLDALRSVGLVKVANEEIADALAEQAGEQMPGEPLDGEVPMDVNADLSATLMELAGTLDAAAQASGAAAEVASGEGAAPEMPAPEMKAAAAKLASMRPNIDALAAWLRKLAVDTPATAEPNTIAAAAQIAAEMADVAKEMPAGHANMGVDGVGNTVQNAEAGSIGHEEPKPEPSATSVGGTNSAIEMTNKSAADAQYERLFTDMVNTYAGYLPPRLTDNEKVAALQFMMGMPPRVRDQMASHMGKTAELPPALAAAIASSEDEMTDEEKAKKDEEKKDEKKDEEKDEEKKDEKNAAARRSLLDGLRAVRR